jgi:hypothetical protein
MCIHLQLWIYRVTGFVHSSSSAQFSASFLNHRTVWTVLNSTIVSGLQFCRHVGLGVAPIVSFGFILLLEGFLSVLLHTHCAQMLAEILRHFACGQVSVLICCCCGCELCVVMVRLNQF